MTTPVAMAADHHREPAAVRRRRPSMSTVGMALVAVAVLWVIALPIVADARRDAAVAGLARVAAGCVAVVDVANAGERTIYVETRGRLEVEPGTCVREPRDVDLGVAPRVVVRVTDGRGDVVVQRRAVASGYDTGAFVGEAVRELWLEPGRYEVSVTADDRDALVAIGIDVEDAARPWRTAGLAGGAVGVLAGLALVLRGVASPSRRDRTR